MADLSSGGKASNVAVTDQWTDEARMGFTPAFKRIGELRPMPRVLGIPRSGGLFTAYSSFELHRLAVLGWLHRLSCPEYLYSSFIKARLPG